MRMTVIERSTMMTMYSQFQSPTRLLCITPAMSEETPRNTGERWADSMSYCRDRMETMFHSLTLLLTFSGIYGKFRGLRTEVRNGWTPSLSVFTFEDGDV